MTETPTRDWLAAAILKAWRKDCPFCGNEGGGKLTCPAHAAEAVCEAVRQEQLFIMPQADADALIEQAKKDGRVGTDGRDMPAVARHTSGPVAGKGDSQPACGRALRGLGCSGDGATELAGTDMTSEEILGGLRAIVEAAEGRDLTDEEATNYERLEAQLATARRNEQIRDRTTAYDFAMDYLLDGAARDWFQNDRAALADGPGTPKPSEDWYAKNVVDHLRRAPDPHGAAFVAMAQLVRNKVGSISEHFGPGAEEKAVEILMDGVRVEGRVLDALEELVRSEISERHWHLVVDDFMS